MAFKHASGLKLLLKKGDGASPETFTAICSLTAKTIQHQGTENTFDIPDCSDPEAVSWLVSELQNKRIVVSGNGTLNTPDYDELFEWWDGGEDSNLQLVIDVPAADGGRILEGAFKLPSFEITGNRGEKMNASVTIASSGPVTKTNNT